MRSPLVLLAGAALSLSVLPAHAVSDDEAQPVPAVANAWSASGDEAVPASDNVIVHWDSGVGRTARAQVRGDVNTEDFRNLGNARFQLLTLAEGQDPDQAVRELRANPDVASASRDRFSVLRTPPNPTTPCSISFGVWTSRGLNVGGVGSSTIGDDISALDAWSKTVGDKSAHRGGPGRRHPAGSPRLAEPDLDQPRRNARRRRRQRRQRHRRRCDRRGLRRSQHRSGPDTCRQRPHGRHPARRSWDAHCRHYRRRG